MLQTEVGYLPQVPTAPATLTPALLERRDVSSLQRLNSTQFRVYPFQTRRRGESRAAAPRTVGYTAMLLDQNQAALERVGAGEAAEVAHRGHNQPRGNESAKEKVVFCGPGGETRVYQADRQNRTAALCACGNATGAAAAMLAHCLGQREVHQDLQVPDGRLTARSTVARLGDGWRVEQSWVGIRFEAREAVLLGRRVAVCHGSLNDYLIVLLSGPEELEEFGLQDALALWREARQFSGFSNPLQSRLAAIAPMPGDRPFARFYTCGRMHPGGPLTGLAALSLAASRIDWVAAALRGGEVQHLRDADALPAARATTAGYEIAFPTIDATLLGA